MRSECSSLIMTGLPSRLKHYLSPRHMRDTRVVKYGMDYFFNSGNFADVGTYGFGAFLQEAAENCHCEE